MKKIYAWVIGVVVVAAAAFYILWGNSGTSNIAANTPSGSAGGGTSGTPNTTPTPTPTGTGPSTTPTPTPVTPPTTPKLTPTGQYKDGTYTGPVTDAIYGQVQVVATIKGGKLVDTNCPIYPNSGGHSSEVSQFALPQLRQEAIAAQSANVNIVSGATQTSLAYQQSLAAALTQAKS